MKLPIGLARRTFFGAALLCASARADSADQILSLSWNAPQGCPSKAMVTNEVKRILGGTTLHRATARADVVELGPQRWTVHLVTDVDDVPGERSLEANSCDALASATALILAFTVDPARALAATPPRSSPTQSAPQPTPPAQTSSRNTLQITATASGAGEIGSLPSTSVGGEVSIGVLLGPVRGEISAADWFAQDAGAPAAPGQGTRIHLLDGALRGCFRVRLGDKFEVDPCGGATLVFASSSGFGEDVKFEESSSWTTLDAGLLSSWRIAGPLALRATLGLGVPLTRPSFVLLDPQGETFLHRTSVVVGRASLGLEVRFP
jgi:hypothetical protein